MAEYVQVVKRAFKHLGGHGGVRGAILQLLRVNDLKTGTLVGVDKYGNKYYEDKRNFFGRHRWVVYTSEMNGKNTFWEVDGSMVPPEWQKFGGFTCLSIGSAALCLRKLLQPLPSCCCPPLLCISRLLLFRHRWLHSMTDDPPTTHPPVARKFIWENHKFNLSGTPGQYVPYSTTRKKIQEWIPPTTASK
ncbi:NADH dehydrogenase [ubiquinone] 1 alpha subcomplex subunit 12 isoform X1 [Gallus gallus]|uniref:NADH dehydrogenase [ubiquinone] 1 alpha subcomplex subunit 12 n=2 Tax=Phasianidae TaxID=9005 RepID=A0A8V0Y6X8_CHICK|nr:NADH dehydrogenase [ubiquinone] 1 alpha subcomplex subunit 12 isoform X1 [Gallus gallus]|eukprot:XP_025003952.1 NADH dehydrogenase [ubiquinone] 1 alpha subcomplex subunit 12 isoform X1 [Gallus gallus]